MAVEGVSPSPNPLPLGEGFCWVGAVDGYGFVGLGLVVNKLAGLC